MWETLADALQPDGLPTPKAITHDSKESEPEVWNDRVWDALAAEFLPDAAPKPERAADVSRESKPVAHALQKAETKVHGEVWDELQAVLQDGLPGPKPVEHNANSEVKVMEPVEDKHRDTTVAGAPQDGLPEPKPAEHNTSASEPGADAEERSVPPPCSGKLKVDVLGCRHVLPADDNGKSDVYVTLQLGKQKKQKTKVQSKTLDPQFGEAFELSLEVESSEPKPCLLVEVWDRDRGSKDDFLGQVSVSLGEAFGTGWVDTELRRSYVLTDPTDRLVDGKGTAGKELSKRKASGDASPYGSVELCLSFRPEDMNAAAAYLHAQKQREEIQQVQLRPEEEQKVTLTSGSDDVKARALEAHDTAEDASDSDGSDHAENSAETAAQGGEEELLPADRLGRVAAVRRSFENSNEVDSKLSAELPASSAVEVDSGESESEPAVTSLATSELASAVEDLQQQFGGGFESFQAAFSVCVCAALSLSLSRARANRSKILPHSVLNSTQKCCGTLSPLCVSCAACLQSHCGFLVWPRRNPHKTAETQSMRSFSPSLNQLESERSLRGSTSSAFE